VETTYGDRDHKTQGDSIAELEQILEGAVADGGVVLLPAFALGRTQDVLYHVNAMKEAGRLKDLDVYVDSPMATKLTSVFRGSQGFYDEEARTLLRHGDDPLTFEDLRFVGDWRESERIGREARRALIISASGMCQGGRVTHHLAHLLPRPSTRVVFVGYQAPGTLGRRLVSGAKVVRIRGREVAVNATIHTLGGFSAHAGRRELLDWVRAIEKPPQRVFLVHGEPSSLEAFAKTLREDLGLEVHVPTHGESVPL
jgi:metallo-beta-lactamase family protein